MVGVQMDLMNRIRNLKQDAQDAIERDQRQRTMQKYLPRWMERTEEVTGQPCRSYEEILWDD